MLLRKILPLYIRREEMELLEEKVFKMNTFLAGRWGARIRRVRAGVRISGTRSGARIGGTRSGRRVDGSGTPVVSKADGRTAWGECRRLIFNAVKIRHPIGTDQVC